MHLVDIPDTPNNSFEQSKFAIILRICADFAPYDYSIFPFSGLLQYSYTIVQSEAIILSMSTLLLKQAQIILKCKNNEQWSNVFACH